MNIELLLKRFSNQAIEEESEPVSSDRRKKNNSRVVGAVNEMAPHYDRPYFNRQTDQIFPLEDSPLSRQNNSKIEKLNSELVGIERMKSEFESRKKQDNSILSAEKLTGKSLQKHSLKPTSVPRLGNATTEFKINNSCDLHDNRLSHYFQPQSISIHSQVISAGQNHESLDGGHDECYEIQESRVKSQNQKEENCNCELVMANFMMEIRQKMTLLSNRLTNLEESRHQLRERHQSAVNQNNKYSQRLLQLRMEKEGLRETENKWKGSKLQLESLLKDVLFKREKEKIQKENRHKQDDVPLRYREKGDKIEKSQKMERQKSEKQIRESKNKVENLLQKLHLKVEKS